MNGALCHRRARPGPERWLTPEASDALAQADALVGYEPYIDRVPERAGLERFPTDNRVEISRGDAMRWNWRRRVASVAVVSGGDAGVFAHGGGGFRGARNGRSRLARARHPRHSRRQRHAWRRRRGSGAPLGHDFCALSLSDNLKPWEVIARRLRAAAEGDFVIALYNPASKARPRQIFDAFDLLRARKDGATPVAFARAVGRPDERIVLTDSGRGRSRPRRHGARWC